MNATELLTLAKYQERSYEEQPNRLGWIDYGDDNLFPQYLVDLYHSSATHNALCTSIAYMIFGDGLHTDDPEARLKIAEWELDDEIRKACLDLKIQGGFALEVQWSLDRSSVARVRHCPYENIRATECDDKEVVRYYMYSTDWENVRQNPPEQVCAFDPSKAVDHPTQILYVRPFSPGSFYYPKPDYLGAVNYVELEKEISRYHINNIQAGLSPSFSIHFKNGTPPIEERQRIRQDIEQQLAGTTNAGKFIITFSDQPDRKPDFEPFPLSDADKQYQFLSEETTVKLMVGHRVTSPQLFGVAVPGKLGSGAELDSAEAIFKHDVIEPFRAVVLRAVNQLLQACSITARLRMEVSEVEGGYNEAGHTPAAVASVVDILSRVKAGDLTSDQATQILTVMMGLDRETAEAFFASEVALSHDCPSERLLGLPEEDMEGWELIDEREASADFEDARNDAWSFASVVPGDSKRPSELDNDIVRIRYTYDGDLSANSRDFCKKMVRAKRVWRKEDIINAGSLAVNPGFGEGGSDTYSIWEFKGGPNCKHRWIRQTYLKKENNRKVSVAEAKRIISQIEDPAERKRNQIKPEASNVSRRPADMPNNGYKS